MEVVEQTISIKNSRVTATPAIFKLGYKGMRD
ncbi:hypothetical protein J2Z81_001933 [Virgibacillus campisalis]|uniref:Uncharacterized protein n=1 Tax=Virgibacillus alimentarius TaxID=698769 RepID=A0ABS4S8Y2_9BACI|nr:hypothetical protein [Virgibacillus alimentarius]